MKDFSRREILQASVFTDQRGDSQCQLSSEPLHYSQFGRRLAGNKRWRRDKVTPASVLHPSLRSAILTGLLTVNESSCSSDLSLKDVEKIDL